MCRGRPTRYSGGKSRPIEVGGSISGFSINRTSRISVKSSVPSRQAFRACSQTATHSCLYLYSVAPPMIRSKACRAAGEPVA